jgi:hypothetical protein
MSALILTWLAKPANLAKLAAGAALAALLAFIGVQTLELNSAKAALAKAQAKAALAGDQLIIASGQAAAQQSAAATAASGAEHAAVDITLHQENADAIQHAPGAAAPIDPALNRVGLRGMCRYADLYGADPACAGLRGDHPAQLPPARAGDPTASR